MTITQEDLIKHLSNGGRLADKYDQRVIIGLKDGMFWNYYSNTPSRPNLLDPHCWNFLEQRRLINGISCALSLTIPQLKELPKDTLIYRASLILRSIDTYSVEETLYNLETGNPITIIAESNLFTRLEEAELYLKAMSTEVRIWEVIKDSNV